LIDRAGGGVLPYPQMRKVTPMGPHSNTLKAREIHTPKGLVMQSQTSEETSA
jgi:hypothetical protein